MNNSSKSPLAPNGRADEILLSQGKVDSRAAAQKLIKAGQVLRENGEKVTKPSQKLPEDEELVLLQPLQFVSRGGDKLESWFLAYPMDINGLHALDVGSSTGGFTDCLLQRGAAEVTGVDVGHGQLHPRLDDDDRVTNFEGVNARELDAALLPHLSYPLVVADLSFISLKLVLRPIWNRVAPGGTAIFLVKPQFEVAREVAAKKKGVIRDDQLRAEALAGVLTEAQTLPGATLIGQLECPIHGGEGNREFLIGLKRA